MQICVVMKRYKQLDLKQRYQIETLYREGFNQSQIADRLEVHRSTISRELQRNMPTRGRNANQYKAIGAQQRAMARERNKPRSRRFTPAMLSYIRDRLRMDKWSPELISGRGKLIFGDFISHEWIYQYIWAAKHSRHQDYAQDGDLHTYLKHYGRRRKRSKAKNNRGFIQNRVGIEQRPKIVESRTRYGDIEVDFMMGTEHKPGLIVLTDRKTIETKLIKIKTKNSKSVAKKIISKLKAHADEIHTMTFDNDLGFAAHEWIAKKLGIDTYFTRPYTSQDKGTVENRIGVIRRFLPKKTNMGSTPHQTIKSIEKKLNDRPVRKFAYLTPSEYYQSLVAVDT